MSAGFCALWGQTNRRAWDQTNWNRGVCSIERFTEGPSKETRDLCPKNQNSREGFSKALLKARWGRGEIHCCKPLGIRILCPCSCPQRSGLDVPVSFQQHKCFWNILCLHEWTLKSSGPWEWTVQYVSVMAIFFHKRFRASMTKHRPSVHKV